MKAIGRHSLASVLSMIVTLGRSLSWLLLVVGIIILTIAPWVDPPDLEVQFTAPVAITLDAASHHVTPRRMDAERVRLDDLSGTLYFSPHKTADVVAGALTLIACAALSVWVLGNLQGVFVTLRAGRPFVPANATRIRRVAWGLLALEIARTVVVYAMSAGVMTRFEAEGLAFRPLIQFDVIAVVATLILFVIAEVFREGARLDEEQSLTV
jgi:hypothetical protein